MNTPVYETIRADLEQIKELMAISGWWKPSHLKAGWIRFQVMHRGPYIDDLKAKGAWVRPVTMTVCEVHVSLTKLTNKELLEVGLIPNAAKFARENAVTIAEAGYGGEVYTAVRDGLFRVKFGDDKFYIIMPNTRYLEKEINSVLTQINNYTYQWGKWQATAKVKEVDGKDVLKFENGLSVRMELTASTFCQAAWEGDHLDFSSPYEFFWWLKRFF